MLLPGSKGAGKGVVGEARDSLLQGCSVVMPPVSCVPPGVEGAQQCAIGELGQSLLESCPVVLLAVTGGAPSLEYLTTHEQNDTQIILCLPQIACESSI